MDFRVVLLDRNGVARAELYRVQSAVWSWVLNGEGAAEITIDSDDPAATVALMTKAPLVVIYSDAGNWGGVLKKGLRQQGHGLTVRAYGNARLLRRRQTGKTRNLDGKTNGSVVRQLLLEANNEWPTLVDIGGYIYDGGVSHYYEIHYDDLLDRFQDMAAGDGHDFEVTWDRKLNWYLRKGSDKPNVVLSEGRNVVRYPSYTYTEDGIVNDQHCVGSGITWKDTITSNEQDQTSQYTYGLWQRTDDYRDVIYQETLDLRAETLLANRKDPSRTLDLSIVDRPSGLWGEFSEGDEVRVILPSYHLDDGFDDMVKVLAREVDARAGIMRVVVEVD